jgi:hypothetical protein
MTSPREETVTDRIARTLYPEDSQDIALGLSFRIHRH